jgi:hypothetical protein
MKGREFITFLGGILASPMPQPPSTQRKLRAWATWNLAPLLLPHLA